jgi:hypothetical protein
MNRTRLVAGLFGAIALTALAAPAAHASHLPPVVVHQPARGTVITCDRLGRLTGTDGYLDIGAPVVDVHGHGYVYFTVQAQKVTLAGTDGATYRLFGTGYDTVVRSTTNGHSPILSEDEGYRFDVVDADGVVGRIRFALHQGTDGTVHAHDTGDCHLPKSDE